MNAQQAQMNWKELYKFFTDSLSFKGNNLIREDMYRYRREAALERRCEAQYRMIVAQAEKIERLEYELDEHQNDPRVPIEIRDPRWSNDRT